MGKIDHLDNEVIVRMQAQLAAWELTQDDRVWFLGCYRLMTNNMLTAIDQGRFRDTIWVRCLLTRFAEYYFEALSDYERRSPQTPEVWSYVFDCTCRNTLHVLQNILLGINAHINYDLVFTLQEILAKEWHELSPEKKQERYEDHCMVNTVIAETIDEVQDKLIEPEAPLLGIIDRLMGRLDEHLLSSLISGWREDVWMEASNLLDSDNQEEHSLIKGAISKRVLRRAHTLVNLL